MSQLSEDIESIKQTNKSLNELEGKLDAHENRESILRANADTGVQFVTVFCSLTDAQLESLLFTRQLALAMNGNFTTILKQNARTKVNLEVDEIPGQLIRSDSLDSPDNKNYPEVNLDNKPERRYARKQTRANLVINGIRQHFPEIKQIKFTDIVEKFCSVNLFGQLMSYSKTYSMAYQALFSSSDKNELFSLKSGYFNFLK